MTSFQENPYSSLDDENNEEELYTEEEEDSLYSYDAEAEWEESKEQLCTLFSFVIFPCIGKWLGKKFSYWIWAKCLGSRTPFTTRYSILSTEMVNSIKRIS
ncbi:uncharacterized protein BX663DRAFT_516039 [Cokeromyces recurvatus]|uniref:uncharacterized protein n=1 Tax=Cokeromyces recurvatus TaxID=90255 RepID=UPI00221FCD08|nr:uncharacterized protein BX663DRAFT_516039 [Cokeromyces recurvatus]KAI7901024.1 hypothetical protein BX663DRAFT_516039 [Cokeromyces recurvatus]